MTELPAANPLEAAGRWISEATLRTARRNPLAMALATSTAEGRPSLRMVLLKSFDEAEGYAVFYTHYGSRKSRELKDNPRAAAVLYWEELGRQLRMEGTATRSPAAESDGYFATRPCASQLNAVISQQSAPIGDPRELWEAAQAKARELGLPGDAFDADSPCPDIRRPEHWGGLRLWVDSIEFWLEGTKRFHERARFTRALAREDGDRFTSGPWQREYLQP